MKRILGMLGRTGGTVLVAGLMALQANALPITGEIHFFGSFTPVSGGSPSSLGAATGIDFSSSALVASGSGAYSVLTPFLTTATMNDFTFSPSLSPDPVTLWSVTQGSVSFSFVLQDIDVDLQSANQLNLSGTGVLYGTGYDNTPGTWNFQGGGSAFFTFRADSSGSGATGGGMPVPDSGATLWLFGIALACLALSSPLKRSKSL